MQQRLANEGLILVTVSVDDKDDLKAVETYLREQNAPGPNLLVYPDDGLLENWGYEAAPYLVVIDRGGNKVKSYNADDHVKVEDLEELVRELLKK